MKILVIKRDKLGDLLLTTPMLAHLRARLPQARIDLLANDYNAWVVADEPSIDRRWIYRRVRNGRTVSLSAAWQWLWQTRALRREAYDAVIVANGSASPRAIERGVSLCARRVIAYVSGDLQAHPPRGLTDPLPEPSGHEADRLTGLLAPLGIAPPERPIWPRYRLPEAQDRWAHEWLAAQGVSPGRYVVLGLGARRAKKQPTTAQIFEWTERWRDQYGLETVFMWTPGASDNPLYPGDDEVAEPVLAAARPWIHPFRGPILPALGLIGNARTSVFPDSGLMHFAAASPGGVLGLFADTSVSPPPEQWGPRGPRASFLEAPDSVSQLDIETVFAALSSRLAAGSESMPLS
jgi:ADP-heptose:LPS heptosyltransferase